MFKHILVPLDGSALAESVLPAVVTFAATVQASVTLIHVIELNAPDVVHQDHHLTESAEAEDYLITIAGSHFPPGILVQRHVHTAAVKDVAASIAVHANEFDSDLIIMCSHGQSGMRDMLFGNIAQQVIARAAAPVLLLRPEGQTEKGRFAIHRILVPLDSESRHDEVFPFAAGLARAFGSEIGLLTVIPTYGTLAGEQAALGSLLPGTTSALLDIEEEATRTHLQGHLSELQKEGFVAAAAIARGDPVSEIVAAGARWKADLVLLATHRKAGMDAFWARSVAPKVARNMHSPILLLPLK